MNNLRKFATEADYSAATLNYPAVSWVVSGDTVHFDKTSTVPPVVNTKVKLAFTSDSCAAEKDWYVCTSTYILNYVNSITVNDTPLQPTGSGARITMDANTSYLTEYDLKENVTNVEGQFNISPVLGCESAPLKYDLLFERFLNPERKFITLPKGETNPFETSLETSRLSPFKIIPIPLDFK